MSYGKHNTESVAVADTIGPTLTKTYPLDTQDCTQMSVVVRYKWLLTDAATVGIAITQTYGIDVAGEPSNLLEPENVDTVPNLPQPGLASGVPVTHTWVWSVPVSILPRHVKLHVHNLDASNSISQLDIYVDKA